MKQLVKGIVFAAAALMLMQAPQAQAKVKVKKVTVKSNYGSSVHVAVGKKVKLTTTVKVSPNKSANKKVSYKSSNFSHALRNLRKKLRQPRMRLRNPKRIKRRKQKLR